MRFLFDTLILVSLLRDDLDRQYPFAVPLLRDSSRCVISVASLWEIAIKTRLGKLSCPVDVEDLDVYLRKSGFEVLPVAAAHVTMRIAPDVPTRDPFDRLLVATAQAESLRLVTADRALAGHPVTFS